MKPLHLSIGDERTDTMQLEVAVGKSIQSQFLETVVLDTQTTEK